MAEPFLSEIRPMSFSFAPKGWATCDGQLLPIDQNRALFELLGTTFGGDGRTTFALPDLRGRVPLHAGPNHRFGESAGEQSHELTTEEIPQHSHSLLGATNAATTDTPASSLVLGTASLDLYRSPTNLTPMEPGCIAPVGDGLAHENMQPYMTISFCIALQGVTPTPN